MYQCVITVLNNIQIHIMILPSKHVSYPTKNFVSHITHNIYLHHTHRLHTTVYHTTLQKIT